MGHVQGVHDEFGAVVIGHGIADDLAGGQVQPAGEVEPALRGGQIGDVADQLGGGALGVAAKATLSAGVRNPRHLRGRLLSFAAMASSTSDAARHFRNIFPMSRPHRHRPPPARQRASSIDPARL